MEGSPEVLNEKSDEKAEQFRKAGNINYQERKFTSALLNYNKSIAFGKSKKMVALGYGNRSAVYFELKRYADCLKNIEWAFENKFPREKTANLQIRKAKCEELMQTPENREDPWDFFKLSYPPNKKIPWIADCVAARLTRQNGPGFFATRDLKAGDIICIEDSIVPILHGDICYGRCYNCSKAVFMNLIPCDKFASIMFCSLKCKELLYTKTANVKEFHKDMMMKKGISELVHLAGGDENLTVFDFDWSDPNDPKRQENILKCCLSLPKSIGNIDYSGLFHLNDEFLEEGIGRILTGVNLYFVSKEGDGAAYHTIGLFASQINHSCLPNAIVFPVDNKIVTVILSPVKKSEQIFTIHETVIVMHKKPRNCQICHAVPRPLVDVFPMMLVDKKNFSELKLYIERTLNCINNSVAKPNYWEPYPATFRMIMENLGHMCAFPSKDIHQLLC